MSDESVSEADCVLCRDLDPAQRMTLRADLIVIPLRELSAMGAPWRSGRISWRTPRRQRRSG
jgi:hypothetical protein